MKPNERNQKKLSEKLEDKIKKRGTKKKNDKLKKN